MQRRTAAAFKIGRLQSVLIQHCLSLPAQIAGFGLDGPDNGEQMILVGFQRRFIFDIFSHIGTESLVTLLKHLARKSRNVFPQVPAAALFHLIRGKAKQPAQ